MMTFNELTEQLQQALLIENYENFIEEGLSEEDLIFMMLENVNEMSKNMLNSFK